MILKTWIEQYYKVYRALDLKPTTVASYLRYLSSIPDSWHYETVTLLDVQQLINSLALQGLSSSTIKHIFQVIKEPLHNGSLYGLPERNGLLNTVRLPKCRKKLVTALSDFDLRQLAGNLQKSPYADIYNVLLATGMRYCELAGLNCADFNSSSGTLKIQRSFYRGSLTEVTKTDAGMREIPLNLTAKAIIMRHWCMFTPNQPLFRNLDGSRLSYNTLVHNWHRVCDNSNIKRCGLHVLRHTFATNLLEADVSLKVVSSLLGHKSIAVTADIYCDVTMSAKRTAVERLFESARQTAKPYA